jgi:hypothetical protein
MATAETERLLSEWAILPRTTEKQVNARYQCAYCEFSLAKNVTRMRSHTEACTKRVQKLRQSRLEDSGIVRTLQTEPYKASGVDLAVEAIVVGGRPWNLFECPRMKALLQHFNPTATLPTRETLQRRLPSLYNRYRDRVRNYIDNAPLINLIFDGSDSVSKKRIINVSVQIPGVAAFYWVNLDTGSRLHTASETILILEPVIRDLVGTQTKKINCITTDTCTTMRKTHKEMAKKAEFSHVFFNLCDAHGFDLLAKDIIKLQPFKQLAARVKIIVNYFKKAKLELARLRDFQLGIYKKHQAFVTSSFTRWGSYLAAVRSVIDNHDALKQWAVSTMPKGRDEEAQKAKKISQFILEMEFWPGLQVLYSVLDPIHTVQVRSEADQAHVGHTLRSWALIEKAWHYEEPNASPLEPNPWPALYECLKDRRVKQTYDIHYMAYCLDPTTPSKDLGSDKVECAERFLERFYPADDYPRVLILFHEYLAREGPLFEPSSALNAMEKRPRMYWQRMANLGHPLGDIAVRIFSTLSNSVPSERSFSTMNLIHTQFRNRLASEHADALAFVYHNARVLDRLQAAHSTYSEGKKSTHVMATTWNSAGIAEVLDIEDGWVDLFHPLDLDMEELVQNLLTDGLEKPDNQEPANQGLLE